MGSLKEGKRDGSYLKLLEKIYKSDVLILDDFGLSTFDDKARSALLDIFEDRHGRKSTLIPAGRLLARPDWRLDYR